MQEVWKVNPTPFIYFMASGLMMVGWFKTGAAIYFGANIVWIIHELRKAVR